MTNHPYFRSPAPYASSHHIVGDGGGNTNSISINNSFQVNTSSDLNRRSSSVRNTQAAPTPTRNPHQFLPPPIITNLPGCVVHSQNSHTVRNTHISNFGGLPRASVVPPNIPHAPSTKKEKQRTPSPQTQGEDADFEETSSTSSFDESFSSSFDRAFSGFDHAFSSFDKAFPTSSRRSSRRSHPANPHTPTMYTVPPVPPPTRYISNPHIPISAPIPYYHDPFGGLTAMIDSCVKTTMNEVNQVVHENMQAHNASIRTTQDAIGSARLAAREAKKAKTPSATSAKRHKDVPATRRSPSCPGFAEEKTRDGAGNTITVSKLCSHADCVFMGNNFTPSSHAGFSRSSNSWKTPDCNMACPGSMRHEETDSLGNITVTSRLCSHEVDTIDSGTDSDTQESDTDVESVSDFDDAEIEKAKRASMQPSVQDASDDED